MSNEATSKLTPEALEERLIEFAVRIIAKAGLLKPALLTGLLDECAELKRIFGASLRTARLRSVK